MPKREKGIDTEDEKHRAGGPGKASRSGHLEGGKTGNKDGQNQPDTDTPIERGDGRHSDTKRES